MKFSKSSTKIIIKEGMLHPLFDHVFMTQSEINTSTFCINIFGQFCYISILNYLVKKKKKKTEQEESFAGVF